MIEKTNNKKVFTEIFLIDHHYVSVLALCSDIRCLKKCRTEHSCAQYAPLPNRSTSFRMLSMSLRCSSFMGSTFLLLTAVLTSLQTR